VSNNRIAIKTDSNSSKWEPINKGVRQGCGLSPLLFIIYMNAIIKRWRGGNHGGILINGSMILDTLLFADDQVLSAPSEDELQQAIYNLQKTVSDFDMSISIEKTKIMAFSGKDPVRSKICISNKTLEQVNTFNYLGCTLCYEDEKDMPAKISKFVKMIGVIDQVFKPSLVQQHTRLNIYRTLARPVLVYGSEAWTIRKADEKILQAAEMKFMRKTAGLTLWDHKRNEEILKNLKVEPISKFIQNYRANWKEHIDRMDSSRIPNNLLNYRPHGKRSLGRPLKRWSETVTGHLA
jgi:hypothetical protein